MGQRLVINIIKDDERIANIYYHWSAYSISALEEAKKLIDSGVFDEDCSVKELQLKLVRLIESFGGCIDGGYNSKEYLAISEMFPDENFKHGGSRNNGLIAITENAMNDIEGWAEGTIDINLDDDYIYNSVYCVETLKEYNDWRDKKYQKKLEDIPERTDININLIPFGDLEDMIDCLKNIGEYEFRQGNMIYELIE